MRPDGQFLTAVCTRRRSENEIECVFGINSQATDLGATNLERSGYGARLVAIAIETQRA